MFLKNVIRVRAKVGVARCTKPPVIVMVDGGYGVEEKHVKSRRIRLISRTIKVTRFPSTPPSEVSQTVTQSQRTNHLNIWMLLHTEHFPPLSAASGASPNAEGMKSVYAGAHLSSQVSPNSPHQHPLYQLNPFCSHKLLADTKFSSTGNAACNHYSGLIILYGSP